MRDGLGPVPFVEWGQVRRGELDSGGGPLWTRPAGQNLDVLFDDLSVQLPRGRGRTRGTCCGCFQVPVNVSRPAEFMGYLTELRGSVNKTEGTRLVLVADLGGVVSTHEYPYGPLAVNDQAGGLTSPNRKSATGPASHSVYTARFGCDAGHSADADPDRPHVPPFFATLLLVVERDGPADSGALYIDSLHVTAVFGPAGQKHLAPPSTTRVSRPRSR